MILIVFLERLIFFFFSGSFCSWMFSSLRVILSSCFVNEYLFFWYFVQGRAFAFCAQSGRDNYLICTFLVCCVSSLNGLLMLQQCTKNKEFKFQVTELYYCACRIYLVLCNCSQLALSCLVMDLSLAHVCVRTRTKAALKEIANSSEEP